MFARSSTFHGKPDTVDAGIKFIIGEAAPMLQKSEGCLGVSFLVDRETGMCIATSSWETEEAMHNSEETLRPMRDRSRDLLHASMQVDEWEIAMMHRMHHAECCRVSWLQGDLDALVDSFRMSLLPQLEDMSGFCSASLLINRWTGLGCATTAWESTEAMVASRPTADEMRARAAADTGGEIVQVHEFELAYAHLHVPEMA